MGKSWSYHQLTLAALRIHRAHGQFEPLCEGALGHGEPPHVLQLGDWYYSHATGRSASKRTLLYCKKHYFMRDIMTKMKEDKL